MAHLYRVTAQRSCPEGESTGFSGPMAAVSDPKTDFIQSLRGAIQDFRYLKQIEGKGAPQ